MIKHCPRCSNAVEMKTLDKMSAEDAPLKLTVTGMPAAKCAKGHATPIDGDFMLWLIRELKARGGTLAAAEAKGMLFKNSGCGKEQIRSAKELQGHAAQAIAALNDAAGFPHSG